MVIVGLPFPSLASLELKERMRYVSELEVKYNIPRPPGAKNAGAELYENICMKSVNQSIGAFARRDVLDFELTLKLSRSCDPSSKRLRKPYPRRRSVCLSTYQCKAPKMDRGEYSHHQELRTCCEGGSPVFS